METTLQTSYQCPYGAEECPKIEDTEEQLKTIRSDLETVKRSVYLILGFLLVEFGVSLI